MTSLAMPSPGTNHWFARDIVSRKEDVSGRAKGKKTLMSVPERGQGTRAKKNKDGAQGSKITLQLRYPSGRTGNTGSCGIRGLVLSVATRVPEGCGSKNTSRQLRGWTNIPALGQWPVTEEWLDGGVTSGCGVLFGRRRGDQYDRAREDAEQRAGRGHFSAVAATGTGQVLYGSEDTELQCSRGGADATGDRKDTF